MATLVLLRHGLSAWNKENRFTGWTDVDLNEEGIVEAKTAARLLIEGGFTFDVAFTSVLKRAIRTSWIVLEAMDLMWVPVYRSWRLNERHYGALQGLNKAETALKYGEEQVRLWRRSYSVRPPALDRDDSRYPGHDPRYKHLTPDELPLTESLQDTVERFLPYYHQSIVPTIQSGQHVLTVAHGNSLRALVKYLNHIGDEDIADVYIPTGIPLVYEFDETLTIKKQYYLGGHENVTEAMKTSVNQTGLLV